MIFTVSPLRANSYSFFPLCFIAENIGESVYKSILHLPTNVLYGEKPLKDLSVVGGFDGCIDIQQFESMIQPEMNILEIGAIRND